MYKLFAITTLLFFLSITLTYGQTCQEQKINKLQGIWIDADRTDTTLFIIKGLTSEINYKGSRNWDEPRTLNITHKIPQIPDSIFDCRFIELISTYDTLHYKILEITDTSMNLIRYSLVPTFDDENGNPQRLINRITNHYKKTEGLPKNYNLRESVFGTFWDEDTQLILKPDSTFSITFSKTEYKYSTCGKFWFDGKGFVLKDIQDKTKIIYTIDCDNLKTTPINIKSGHLENKHILFDENNEIHLYCNWMGLWLKETHMTLTKMR